MRNLVNNDLSQHFQNNYVRRNSQRIYLKTSSSFKETLCIHREFASGFLLIDTENNIHHFCALHFDYIHTRFSAHVF